MKRLLWILPLLLLFSCNNYRASRGPADWIYVATTGNDGTGDGTSGAPYLTIAKGVSEAAAGDTVYVVAGTYNLTAEVVIPVGVSIYGAGATSIILSHVDGTRDAGGITGPTISLQSTTQGTDGNQSISYIKIDGDGLIGDIGIYVKYRNNVKIHHCTIEDFYISGIIYQGGSASNVEPTTYMTDGEIHNCTITNCGDEAGTWNGGGALNISGTDGFLVYDNVITNIARTAGVNGNIMNGGYYNKGLKYYRNKSYKPDDNTQWNFHIEHWNGVGGIEIYDNEFYGGNVALDIAGFFNVKGSYDYAWSVHDNLFTTYSGGYATATSDKECVLIEGPDNEDIYIYRNLFEKIPCPLSIKCRVVGIASNIYAYYNIMNNCGINSASNYSNLFRIALTVESPITFSNIYILNNIIKGDNVTRNMMVVGTAAGTTINGLYIRNNIIMDTDNGAFLAVTNTGTMDGLYIDNNCLYGNPNSNDPTFSGNAVTNYTFNDNVKSDPLFISTSDYHLKSISPCINKGTPVGLTTDFAGHRVPQNDTVDIGAHEYGDYLVKFGGKYLRDGNGKFKVIH